MIDAAQFFPYKTFDELNQRVEDLSIYLPSGKRISAKSRPAVAVRANEHELCADEELAGWKRLQATIRVIAQQDAGQSLLPKGSKLGENTIMVVSVSCERTKLRRRVFLPPDPDRNGEWYAQIDLDSGDLSDVLELRPMLVRSTRLPEKAPDETGVPLATFRGAILAFGEPVRLRVDPPKDRHGSLKIRWEDFSKSENELQKSC